MIATKNERQLLIAAEAMQDAPEKWRERALNSESQTRTDVNRLLTLSVQQRFWAFIRKPRNVRRLSETHTLFRNYSIRATRVRKERGSK
jgi:hypothetical protein